MPEVVSDYALPSNRTDQLLDYPFSRPDESFATDGTEITPLSDYFHEFYAESNDILRDAGLPSIDQRVAVVAYGANSNPVRLRDKMEKFGSPDMQPHLQTVPHLLATMPDTMVAWHGKPGQSGSVFAELYRGPETEGISSQVHVAYLTPLQLAMLHATEGVTYNLARVQVLDDDGYEIPAVAYVAGSSEILLQNGQPVPVKRANDNADAVGMTAEQAVDYMLQHVGSAVGASNARELIAQMKDLSLAEKKARQASISQALGQVGVNRKFRFPVADTERIGRADFNWIQPPHTILQLAEQVVAPLRPEIDQLTARVSTLQIDEGLSFDAALTKARKQLDIAQVLRTRAHNELAERLK